MAKNFTDFLTTLEKESVEVLRVSDSLDPAGHEIGAYLKLLAGNSGDPVVIFENVKNLQGKPSIFPLVHNVFATRSLCAMAIGEPASNDKMALSVRFGELQEKPGPCEIIERNAAPVLQNVWLGEQADVTLLPAARYHEKDAGPYFVMACMMKSRSGDFYDVTMTKNMVHGPQRLSISAHGVHHLARMIAEYEAAGEPAPVAIVLGHHPAFFLGSCALTPYGNNDYETISAYMGEPLRLVPSASLGDDFLVPADAEIIIEGFIPPGVREPQNPFGEISGHYQKRMMAPVVDVKAICFRENAIMEGMFPARAEHFNLGSVPKEGSVFNSIKRVVPDITAVYLPHSGCGRFSCYISMKKQTFRDVQAAAMIAFTEVMNLKLVVVVDDDVDVFNEAEVMWAVTTQTRWDKDVAVIPRVQSFRSWLGDAVCIIDATHPDDVADFPERNRVPAEVEKKIAGLFNKKL